MRQSLYAAMFSGKPPDDSLMSKPRPIYRFTKRALDLICVLSVSPFVLPVMVIVWVLVRVRMGSPAFYSQERAGMDARPFVIRKFRSMIDARDDQGKLLPDKDRLTSLGRILRRSSLDELPQLWNVLVGDMSLVGPRPLWMEYVPRYSTKHRRRLDIKPGITGLAQIAGRNTLGWDERFDLDVKYVDTASIGLDLLILLRTVKKVLFAEGVPSSGTEINKKFMGSSVTPMKETASPDKDASSHT